MPEPRLDYNAATKMNSDLPPRQKLLFTMAALVFTVACLILLAVKLKYPARIDAIAVTLLALAALPWILPYLKEMKLPGGIELTFKEKLESVSQQLTDQQQQLDLQREALRKLIENVTTYSISGYIYGQLQDISKAQNTGGEFLYRHDGSMWRNLRFLMDHGYIEEVFPEPNEGANIRDIVRITPAGRDLIALRLNRDGTQRKL